MFYLVKSNTKSVKDKIIEGLIQQNGVSEEDTYIFDYEEIKTVEPAFLEYLTLDFEGKTKAIIIKNADFINKVRVDQQLENRFRSAVLLTNKNILIMTVDKLNKTGQLRKKFESDMTILEKDAPGAKEISSFIKKFFENRNVIIGNSEIELIKSRLSDDFDLLISELNKLDTLQTTGKIERSHIENSTLDFSRERLFKIAEYTITLNETKVEEVMNQYRAEGEGPYLIGEFMIKDLSKLLRYKLMKKDGYNDSDIKEITGWNPWSIKNYSKWVSYWPDEKVLKDFLYNIVLKSCFIDLLNNQPDDPLGSIEKILISNILRIKNEKPQQ